MRRSLVIAVSLLALPAVAAGAGPDFRQHGPLEVGRRIVRWTKASETTGEPRVLDTLIWYPAAAGGGAADVVTENAPVAESRWPVILFSHGSCGLPGQSPFYVETLASWGFVVAAPPHPGNQTVDPECSGGRREDAIADSYANRVADIRFVLDQLVAASQDAASPFFRRIDPRRVGVSGHSFGGQTTLRVAAAEPRVKAAVALAPAAPSGITVRTPTMILAAELDSLTTWESAIARSYAALAGPRYLVELLNTGHCAFALLCAPSFCGAGCEPGTLDLETAHDLTLSYALPFFLKYVAGNGRFEDRIQPGAEPPFAVVHVAVPGTLPVRRLPTR
jgi:predicted dienelactone hydrolase